MTRHKIFSMAFGKVYPAYVAKAEKKRAHESGGRRGHPLADRIHAGGAGKADRGGSGFRDVLCAGAEAEPGAEADNGRGVRRARGSGRGPADAGDTVSGQAGGRAGDGQGDGEDFEGVGGVWWGPPINPHIAWWRATYTIFRRRGLLRGGGGGGGGGKNRRYG